MEGVLRYATMHLEVFNVPATLVTSLVLMEGHVKVSEKKKLQFAFFPRVA